MITKLSTKSIFYQVLVIGLAMSGTLASAQNLNDSLIAYYPLNGNALDSTSNGFDLTNNGATNCPNFKGEPNKAFYFNGSNSYMSLVPASQLMPLNYTVSCYMKIDGMPNNGDFSIAIDNGGTGKDHGLQIARNYNGYDGIGAFTYKLNSATNAFHVSNGFDTSAWHFYTISRSSDSIILYIDGMRDGAAFIGDDAGYSGANLGFYLGCRHGNQKFFNGRLDEVKLWSRALNPAEVAQLYNNTITGIEPGENEAMNSISVYPNPSSGLVKISHVNMKNPMNISVVNALGQVTQTTNIHSDYSEIEITKKGIYFLRFQDENGKLIGTKKIVIQ